MLHDVTKHRQRIAAIRFHHGCRAGIHVIDNIANDTTAAGFSQPLRRHHRPSRCPRPRRDRRARDDVGLDISGVGTSGYNAVTGSAVGAKCALFRTLMWRVRTSSEMGQKRGSIRARPTSLVLPVC